MPQGLSPTPFDPEASEAVCYFRGLLRDALVQGVFENNLRLARTMSEWGGPLLETQLTGYLHELAFSEPNPDVPGADIPATPRPSWREVPPGSRTSLEHLDPIERDRWVQRVSDDVRAMTGNLKASLDLYAQRPDTAEGRIVSGDTLLHMLESVHENPVLGLAAFRYVDSQALAGLPTLVSRLRDRAIDLAPSSPVVLMAGGQGSGKTTVAQHLMSLGWSGAIVDSPWVSERDIRTIRNQGREAWIIYVDRAFEDAFLSMIHRAADEGRMVNPSDMAQTHAQVPTDLLRAAALFRNQPRVSLWHIQNRAVNVRTVEILGGPLHREGKDAFNSIRNRTESRDRAAYEAIASTIMHDVQNEIVSGARNPYPTDLLVEIGRGLAG